MNKLSQAIVQEVLQVKDSFLLECKYNKNRVKQYGSGVDGKIGFL